MLEINKGIGKPVELQGLKGTYLYLAIGIIFGSLILALVLYGLFNVNTYIATGTVVGASFGGIWLCMYLSGKYGVSGLLKLEASRNQPKAILMNTARPFAQLRDPKRKKSRKSATPTGRRE
jgi:hypothetical protein